MPNSLARVTSVTVAFVLACACAAPPSAAQTQTKELPATVAGRVTNGEKGVPGVEVVLTTPDTNNNYKPAARATTDAEGRFRLTNVAAGRYQVMPVAPAHVVSEVTGWPPGRPVNLSPGDTVEDMNFALVRGGVITGRVTDYEGRPVIGEQVHVTPAAKGPQRPPNFFMGQRNSTDDRGVYRVYGLPAGQYRVSVGQDRNSGMIRVGGPRRFYRRTFHPAATDEAEAKIVELREGGEVADVDISVAKASRTYRAEGRFVSAETGRPVPGLQFAFGTLMGEGDRRRVGSYGSTGQKSNARGEFVADELAPGSYAIFAVSNDDVEWYSDAVMVDIEDADVTGLEIKIRRGGSLSGVVQIEGVRDRAAHAKLMEQVSLARNIESGADVSAPSWSRVVIKPDGSFRIGGLRPGKLRIMLGWPPVKGLSLLRVERENAEVRDGIDIAEGANISGVRVVLAYGSSVIRGQVNVTGGALPQGARMMVSARRAGTTPGPFGPVGIQPTEVDSRGRFTIEGLAAGDYELQLRVFGPGVPNAPPLKQNVTVAEGVDATATFALNLATMLKGNTP